MYDIFYIGSDVEHFKNLKKRFITIKKVDNVVVAKNISRTKFFYVVWDDIEIEENCKFDYIVPDYDKNFIHVFKNGKYFDGVTLFPAHVVLHPKEEKYRFFRNKKEIDITYSDQRLFDIAFISYYEENAEINYNNLIKKFPYRKIYHIKNVKGIHNAHKKAAEIVNSRMFWVVDADAEILPSFNFDYQVSSLNYDIVHVWHSKNPINDLEYGYGGVKLLPTQMALEMSINTLDMTTSISNKFLSVPVVSNVTNFATDPFNTWKSAFRECCKLSSKIISRQDTDETENRLDKWCKFSGKNRKYENYCVAGAIAGKQFGLQNLSNLDNLKLINDFDWLRNEFSKYSF